jgi:hypothetical protein
MRRKYFYDEHRWLEIIVFDSRRNESKHYIYLNKLSQLEKEVTIALKSNIFAASFNFIFLTCQSPASKLNLSAFHPQDLIVLWLVKNCDRFIEKIITVFLLLFGADGGEGAVSF